MLISHLPDGPTAYFKISNVKLTKQMKVIFNIINVQINIFLISFYFYFFSTKISLKNLLITDLKLF